MQPCVNPFHWKSFSSVQFICTPPDPLAAIGGGVLLLRGRDGREREERGGSGKGRRKGRKGVEKGEGKEMGREEEGIGRAG